MNPQFLQHIPRLLAHASVQPQISQLVFFDSIFLFRQKITLMNLWTVSKYCRGFGHRTAYRKNQRDRTTENKTKKEATPT